MTNDNLSRFLFSLRKFKIQIKKSAVQKINRDHVVLHFKNKGIESIKVQKQYCENKDIKHKV